MNERATIAGALTDRVNSSIDLVAADFYTKVDAARQELDNLELEVESIVEMSKASVRRIYEMSAHINTTVLAVKQTVTALREGSAIPVAAQPQLPPTEGRSAAEEGRNDAEDEDRRR